MTAKESGFKVGCKVYFVKEPTRMLSIVTEPYLMNGIETVECKTANKKGRQSWGMYDTASIRHWEEGK